MSWEKPDESRYNPRIVAERRADPLLACELVEMILKRSGRDPDDQDWVSMAVIEDVAAVFFTEPEKLADFYYNFHRL